MKQSLCLDDFFRDKVLFVESVCSLDWEGMTRDEQCALIGVSKPTIINWESRLDWEWVRRQRTEKFSRRLAKVDHALLREAEKGSLQHIDLAYKRFDGYVPMSHQITTHDLDEGLIDDELKRLSDRRLAAADAISQSGAVDVEGRGPVSGPAEGEGTEKAG